MKQYDYLKSLPSWEKTKQQRKEANKKWYQKNKERLINKQREWERSNPDKTKINNQRALRRYVASGQMDQYMKEYYKKNKDLVRVRRLTNYYKKPLMIYLGSKCQECGSTRKLEFHHTSYELDKENTLDQLKKITTLLCKICHKKIHNS